MKPSRSKASRTRVFWREPLVVRSLILLLSLIVVTEIIVLWRHYTAPVKQGERTAARAERRLGAGPLDLKRTRIDFDRVNARAEALMRRGDMIGMGIAIVEDGQLAFVKTYGETKAGSGDKVQPTTLFRWASVSKGVAATMTALLDQRHKLSLNDPVAKWSSSIRLPKGNENVATLADALSHRLGIVKNAYDDRLEDNIDPREIRGSFGSLYPMCPPGTCFGYQNVGYDLVHEAIEKASGESYDRAAHDLIFGPLGMTSANTTRDGLIGAKSWAQPHIGRRTLPVEEAYYRVPAAGGVNSSIVDLGIWMRAQMGGAPNVLSQSLLFTLHVPRVVTPHGHAGYDAALKQHGYGLGFRQWIYEGHHLVGHRGAVAGYRSIIIFDPAEKVGVAMLWNSLATKPTGFPLEVFDQYYGRPPHDWMDIERP